MSKPRGLGRGLDALLPASKSSRPPPLRPLGGAFDCPLEKIVPNRGQPRRVFREEALEELATSIKSHGLIEPLIVRKIRGEDKYELIAGERRWRASQRAGLREVLVVVKAYDDKQAYEVALIENVQREDLNPLEFAEALNKLLQDFGHTQESLAAAVGKDRSTITNALRLLKLPATLRTYVNEGRLSEGHARALLGAPDETVMTKLAELAIRNQLSVRQMEAEVRASKRTEQKPTRAKSAGIRDLERRLARSLGTRVDVRDSSGKGELRIRYSSLDELDRILEQLL